MGVREILAEWTAFREECIHRRTYHDLQKKKEKVIFSLMTISGFLTRQTDVLLLQVQKINFRIQMQTIQTLHLSIITEII